MAEIFYKSILIMLVLFLFIIPGYVLRRKEMFPDGAALTMSNILLYICQPGLIINSFCVFSEADKQFFAETPRTTMLADFAIVALISAVSILAMFGIAKLVFIKHPVKRTANVYVYNAIFSNCGFLGVPFVDMFTDGNALAIMYVMVFNVVFVTLTWTLGVFLLTGDRKAIKPKKILLNPSIIASAVALLLFFVPEINFFMIDAVSVVQTIPKSLSLMNAPLSMMIVGIRLADIPIKKLFSDKGSYASGGLRLIASPVVTCLISLAAFGAFGGIYPLHDPAASFIYIAPVIAMSMSPAASLIAMSEKFECDKDAATSAFLINTLLSIITIPLCVFAAMSVWQAVL